MRKKRIALCLALCLMLLPLGGCGEKEADGKLTVVCTVFPIYDWVRNIVGESETVEVILLVRDGTDLHSYQPSAQDIVRLRSCDLLIRLGGTADGWVEDALRQAPSESRRDLRLTELDSLILREVADESVAQSHKHRHDHSGHEDHADCAVDEHIWLSLSNAETCVAAIADALAEADGERAQDYRSGGERYAAELRALDEDYRSVIGQAKDPYMVVADRFPFVYLAEEYGIGYLAAFEGCGTDGDADVDTVIRLARALDQRALGCVIITESSDGALADSVIRAGEKKNQGVAVLDSLQSVTAKELEEGKTYLGTMESNLAVLRQVLMA